MAIEPTLTAAMDCSELERSVDAYLDGEFDARERGEADAHLADCDRCRALAEAQGRIRAAVRAKLREAMTPDSGAGHAPPALRARTACAAGALLVFATHGPDDGLVDDAVRSHHRGLPLEVMAASVGEGSIPAWFAGKLDFNPAPPHFHGDGVHVLGARLSHLRELPAAYIRYALPRGQAGLFIVDDPGGRFGGRGREVRVGPQVVHVVAARGYNVAFWRDNEIVYSLVSDLDEKALFELVRTAQAGR